MYVILVAPPGVVSKSTTASIAMNLLRRVEGVKFGPDAVTWQALVTDFAKSRESFELNGDPIVQSALTLESGEFGNLINPNDRDMVDLLVSLWDGKQGIFHKLTKGNGADVVENPWINIVACTTPAWIAGNFPEYVIGGGFTSRCLFVYADTKDKLVAYPILDIPPGFADTGRRLVADLQYIHESLLGTYTLSADATEWGKRWYAAHWSNKPDELDDDRFAGYLARKQTHVHKTAMILCASRKDDLVIEVDDLKTAVNMVTDLERDMQKVFARIGRTEVSIQTERFVRYVHRHGLVTYSEAYQHVHSAFPDFRQFDAVVKGAIAAGLMEPVGGNCLRAKLGHTTH
jgi:hypothetical protein